MKRDIDASVPALNKDAKSVPAATGGTVMAGGSGGSGSSNTLLGGSAAGSGNSAADHKRDKQSMPVSSVSSNIFDPQFGMPTDIAYDSITKTLYVCGSSVQAPHFFAARLIRCGASP
jgi:hypothetical protein